MKNKHPENKTSTPSETFDADTEVQSNSYPASTDTDSGCNSPFFDWASGYSPSEVNNVEPKNQNSNFIRRSSLLIKHESTSQGHIIREDYGILRYSDYYERQPQGSSSASCPPPPPYSPRLSDLFAMSLDHAAPNFGGAGSASGSHPANSSDVITQVDEAGSYTISDYIGSDMNLMNVSSVNISVRGTKFQLDKADMSDMPESILLGVGAVPLEQQLAEHRDNVPSDKLTNFVLNTISPSCLQFVLDVFRDAMSAHAKDAISAAPQGENMHFETFAEYEDHANEKARDYLKRKPTIILLKEDLDYYCLPIDQSPEQLSAAANRTKEYEEHLHKLKIACGEVVIKQNRVFHGLKNCHIQDSPEYHLLTMLCSSGFKPDDCWGFREREPDKTVITSLALVRLLSDEQDSREQSTTPPKLLLFWRKPARKCWWDSLELEDVGGIKGKVRVYVRRVWTLELCVLGAKDQA